MTVKVISFLSLLVLTSAETYYVTPSSNTPCPEEGVSCFTLSQYANKSSDYFASNATLILLTGNHNLDSELTIQNILFLSVTTIQSNTSISCSNQFAKLTFTSISHVSMKGLVLFGCVNNLVEGIEVLIVEQCVFDGQGYDGYGLGVNTVSAANIVRSSFLSNADSGILFYASSRLGTSISNCIFYNNTASSDVALGGAVYAHMSPNILIVNGTFIKNIVNGYSFGYGGAVAAHFSPNMTIVSTTFQSNTVNGGQLAYGGAILSFKSPHIAIVNCTFYNNSVAGVQNGYGGAIHAMLTHYISIIDSTLSNNTIIIRGGGGAIAAYASSNIRIVNSILNNNSVTGSGGGGAMFVVSIANITILNSTLNKNSVIVSRDIGGGGAIAALSSPNISIVNSTFNGNTVMRDKGSGHGGGGGAITTYSNPNITIVNSVFLNNTVTGDDGRGGAVHVANKEKLLSVSITDCIFGNNRAKKGAAFHFVFTSFNSSGFLVMQSNIADHGVVYAIQSTIQFYGNTTLSNNNGSLLFYTSNVTFIENSNIENTSALDSEGGAISAFQSEIVFMGRVNLVYNRATRGGAIAATESKLKVYGVLTISDNKASESGGGIYAYQSEFNNFDKHLIITGNSAHINGGGIYAISSTIRLNNGSKTYIVGNHAEKGGGISLEGSAKIYLLKQSAECLDDSYCISNSSEWISLFLSNNTAKFGGAVYVADETTSTTCYATPFSFETTIHNECFIQDLLPYSAFNGYLMKGNSNSYIKLVNFRNTYFVDNSATIAGDVFYGGLLDRCEVSPIAETIQTYTLTRPSITSISYILNITNLKVKDFDSNTSISSDPVRVCFCKYNQPDCSYHPQPKYVNKGQTFTVSLVVVDHINNSLANSTTGVPKIQAYVSVEAELGEGQSIQETNGDGSCTDLVYSILSPHNTEELHLYADGPCKDSGISIANLTVNIKPCPIGFKDTGLGCECDPIIYPEYISNCSIETETVQRKDNVWFAYLNETDHQGYILHKHCPFDYCHPSIENVSVNLNIQNGADKLCMFNRSGKLCGSCEDGLSLSLGTSRCMPCSNNWLALFIVFALAGVALIAFILKVNFVVAEGTFNALILYANIFAANRAIFFPHDKTKILSVFIAWINLDFGFETCLFDGMDGYVKTWLQLAFPLYVISLVAAIFIISDHYTKFAMLFVGKNIIGTLATLILLSYTKLLRTIIAALQFTTLQYTDGSSELVWLVDANIPYLSPKHIPLFITALLILIVGSAFTLIVFAWQWLVYCPNRGPLRWIISNGKFIAFIDAYHNPYNKDHRYWIGLLFLVRVILYLVSAVNVLGDPRVNLLSIAIVITCILTFQIFIMPWKRTFIHKKNRNNVLDIISLLNIIALTVATLFINQAKNQSIVAYISTGVAFATFLAILVHHVKTFLLNEILQNIKLKFHKFLGVNREMYIDNHTLSPSCHSYKESIADHQTEVNALPEPLDTIDTPEEDNHGESVIVLLTETESNSTNNGLKESTQPALPNKEQSSTTTTVSNTSDTLVDPESLSPTANQQVKTDQDMYSLKQDKPSQQKVSRNGPNEEQLYQDKDQHLLEKTASYSSLTETIPSSQASQFKVSGTTPFEIELPTWASEHQWSTSPSQEEGDQSDDDDEYSPLLYVRSTNIRTKN